MSATREIMAELNTIGGIIARAETDLAADSIFDLTPLESLIEDLCRRIENLPPDQGRDIQPRLLALIDDFGQLGRSIDRKMSDIKSEMGGVMGRRQAMTAYSNNPGSRK